jgi:hypothetical protein
MATVQTCETGAKVALLLDSRILKFYVAVELRKMRNLL